MGGIGIGDYGQGDFGLNWNGSVSIYNENTLILRDAFIF